MELFYGNFKSLEPEFLQYVKQQKTNPLDKFLIITPSMRLGGYLRRKLADECEVLSNIHFTNLSGLFFAVDREFGLDKKPLLKDKNLQDFIVKEILASTNFKQSRVKGFSQGIKATVRDMIDSGVLSQTVQDYAKEGLFGDKQDNEYMLWINKIYSNYIDKTGNLEGLRSYKQFFDDILTQIPESEHLKSFKKIIFYGFYDFTGLQLDGFSKIIDKFSSAVFFPYVKDDLSYKFCEKLFNSNVLSKAKKTQQLLCDEKSKKDIEILNVSGSKDEINSACKKVLELVEQKNYKYSDIVVIARSLEQYKNDIFTAFSQNKIPLNCTIKESLASHPLCVFVLSFLSLHKDDDIESIVQSNYFKHKKKYANNLQDKDFTIWLKNIKKQLNDLDRKNTWESCSEKTSNILMDNIDFDVFSQSEQEIWQKIQGCLLDIKNHSKIRAETKPDEFLAELQYRLENTQISFVSSCDDGVNVLDVLSARGMQFKTIILLGLNEKNFPVLVKEDPFLQDKYRRSLRDAQGFWITEKLDRYLEEKLLFEFSTSALEKLVCVYQRSDIDGKSLTYSTYLLELARKYNIDLQEKTTKIPRRNLEKYDFYNQNLLSEKEIALKSATSIDAKQKFKELQVLDDDFQEKLKLSLEINEYFTKLSRYDGQVGDMSKTFDKINTKGFSASAIQQISTCPMKFFMDKILNLKQDDILEKDEIAPTEIGKLYHLILNKFYEEISVKKLWDELLSKKYSRILQKHIDSVLTKDIAKKFGLYPVLWQALASNMEESIKKFVERDIDENLKDTGFLPDQFELDVFGESNLLKDINYHGVVDRVDINQDTKQFKVIDYKKKKPNNGSFKNVFKNNILQPVIYKELCERVLDDEYKFLESKFLYIEGNSSPQSLTADYYTILQDKIKKYFSLLLEYVKEGKFFITPSVSCRYCDFSAICRKNSKATLARTRKSLLFKQLQGYKE